LKGGCPGLGLAGGCTHLRANSLACSSSHVLNTRGKFVVAEDNLNDECLCECYESFKFLVFAFQA
jgi:hypothetical protein